MVESRWLRWIGPGVVALGAVGFIASTTLGAGTAAVGAERLRRIPADWSLRRAQPPPAAPADLRGSALVSAWTRSSTAMGRSRPAPVVGLGGDRHRADRSTCAPSRSPPARSARSSSSAPMTARHPASRPFDVASGCAWPLATSATSSAARRSIRPGRSIYEMRVDRATPGRPRDLATPLDGSAGRDAILDPPAARRPVRPHLLDRVHVGCRRRPARGPVLRRGRLPDAARRPGWRSDRDARRPRPRRARRARRRPCRDVRGLPWLPCPIVSTDLGPGRRHARRSGRRPSSPRRPTVPGSSTRRSGRRVGLRSVCRSMARRTSISVPFPTASACDSALGPGCRDPTAIRLGPARTRRPAAVRPTGDRPPQLRHLPDGAAVPLDEALR